jgi:peptidoglycan/xylan/chitin deacetylase (PgdA/CDA1 family)
MGLLTVNFTPGTRSNADYMEDGDPHFVSSAEIAASILRAEAADPDGLAGFLLLLHVGAGPRRTDKMHDRLPGLLDVLSGRGYRFVRVDALLEAAR